MYIGELNEIKKFIFLTQKNQNIFGDLKINSFFCQTKEINTQKAKRYVMAKGTKISKVIPEMSNIKQVYFTSQTLNERFEKYKEATGLKKQDISRIALSEFLTAKGY